MNRHTGIELAARLTLLIAMFASVPALAEVSRDASQITFTDAVGLSSELPALVTAREVAGATRATTVPLSWSPLLVTVTPQWRLAPDRDRGVEGLISLQQAIPLDDVRGARRASVTAIADARAATAIAAQLEARLAAASAWIDAWTAAARLEAAERDLVLARHLLVATERGAAAGVFIAPEVFDARAFVAEAETRRTDAEGQVTDAGFTLAIATHHAAPLGCAGPLPEPPLPAATELQRLAQHLPAVAARRLAARAERARAAEERSTRGRQLVLGAELVRDAPTGFVVGASLGFALPHDRGDREARLAEIEATHEDGLATGLAERGAVELARAIHDVEHTGEVLTLLRDQLVPAADAAAASRQRAFDAGETTVVELLTARRTAVTAHARLEDARGAHTWARVEAWLLVEAAGAQL